MFLTPEELITLTGFKIPARQAQWLNEHGIRHYINGQNRVIVTCDALTEHGVGKTDPRFDRVA